MQQNIKALWGGLAANKQITAANMIQYAILRAMAAKSDEKVAIARHLLRKSFTPITRQNKLNNGCVPYQALSPYINNAAARSMGTILGIETTKLLSPEEIEEYNAIYKELTPSRMVKRYSYFFTRQDIFPEYQLVQTAHVALELGSRLQRDEVKDLYFTVCGVENVEELDQVERVLQTMKLDYVVFREPDIGNQKTAIGVYPVAEHKRGVLKTYGLLRFNK